MLAQALQTKCYNGGVRLADLDEDLPFEEDEKVFSALYYCCHLRRNIVRLGNVLRCNRDVERSTKFIAQDIYTVKPKVSTVDFISVSYY